MSEDRSSCIPAPFTILAPRALAPGFEWSWALEAWLRFTDRWPVELAIKGNARSVAAERVGDRGRTAGAAASMSASSSPGPHDETAEIRAVRSNPGDTEGFAELFARHREDLAQLCRRMLHDSASVDDALSEIFLRAHRALPQYDPERPFKPWLRTLAANHCIDALRRRKAERGLFGGDGDGIDTAADAAPSALAALTLREEQHEVLAALDALPDKYRLPLILRFYRELDYEGIAETLGVSKPQVGTLLFRAKIRLREQLAERDRARAGDAGGGTRG